MHYLNLVICQLTAIIALSVLESYPVLKIIVLLSLFVLAIPSIHPVIKSISGPGNRFVRDTHKMAGTIAE
jgi:hypothetical protein